VGQAAEGPGFSLLLYMNGDNDLEQAALADIDELERGLEGVEGLTVLVQLDRSAEHSALDGDWSGARRYRLGADGQVGAIGAAPLEELGEVDSGSPEALADFIAWGASAAPAGDRLGLVIWDHGSGWSATGEESAATKGISSDSGSGGTLSVAGGDLEAALRSAPPLALLGFDACNMSSWELAHLVQDRAGLLVASSRVEPTSGWPYDGWLERMSARGPAEDIALGLLEAWAVAEERGPSLAALDLRSMPEVDEALGALGQELQALPEARAQWPGLVSSLPHTGLAGDRDLLRLSTALAELGPEGSAALTAALKGALLGAEMGEGYAEEGGLSIYAPAQDPDPRWFEGGWAAVEGWAAWMEALPAAP
jgi:hypothetical protein